jgi:hypothetical protein
MAIEYGDGTDSNTGRIIQVVSVVDTDVYSYSSSSWQTYTSAQITPAASDSKILIMHKVNYGGSDNSYAAGQCYKSAVGITNARVATGAPNHFNESNRFSDSNYALQVPDGAGASYRQFQSYFFFLDTASTTNQVTYSFKLKADASNRTVTINRSVSHPGNGYNAIPCTTTTLMEIAA